MLVSRLRVQGQGIVNSDVGRCGHGAVARGVAVFLGLLLWVQGGAVTLAQERGPDQAEAREISQALAEFREQTRILAAQAESAIAQAGIEVRRDIAYGSIDGVDPERLSLDLYLPGPDHPRPARAPMVLYLHGGGWMAGSKAQSFRQPLVFVPEGFVFASANYRLRPEATVAEMAQSAADAVGWLVRHAGEFGGDPHRIFLIGHSAGAHLVSLLGTNAAFLENAGVPPASVRGVISLDTAVYDLPGLLAGTAGSIHRMVFGAGRDLQEEVSPWHHVRYGEPRRAFLIFYSDGRPEGLTQAIPFAQRLRDAGHLATVVEAVGHDHGQVNNLLGTEGDVPTAQILDFVGRHAGASDYREAILDTELVPSPLEYSVLRPGAGVLSERADGALPILLLLHGGGGNRGQLAQWRGLFERAWRSGVLPPMVVATPSATALSYYMDFHDGSERWTTFLAGEFPRVLAERHGGDRSGSPSPDTRWAAWVPYASPSGIRRRLSRSPAWLRVSNRRLRSTSFPIGTSHGSNRASATASEPRWTPPSGPPTTPRALPPPIRSGCAAAASPSSSSAGTRTNSTTRSATSSCTAC